MIKIVKQLLKPFMPQFFKDLRNGYIQIRKRNPSMSKLDVLRYGKVVRVSRKMNYIDDYVRQFSKICQLIGIAMDEEFIYPFDKMVMRMYERTNICSITVDFGVVIDSDLNNIRSLLHKCQNSSFRNRELQVIDTIESLAIKICNELSAYKNIRAKELSEYFPVMLFRKPESFDEALQKILFYNALFWQMGHSHIGLGRLDVILEDYYEKDLSEGVLTENSAKEKLKSFVRLIGKDTEPKSMSIKGDTGQYILLGGIDKTGKNVHNRLTDLFLEIFTELKFPDPKLILRVNDFTSDILWSKAIECIVTGIGSPLIMNDPPIMANMSKFGYDASDVWNVGTSACWEPLIIGKSFDQNNPFSSAVPIQSLNKVILSGKNYLSFNDLYGEFKEEYRKELESVVKYLNFDCSPLFTLFFDECIAREKDFTVGGAIYAYHGTQVLSLPNTINALLNIKSLVYDKKLFTLIDCKRAIEDNFVGMDDFHTLLINTEKKFGSIDKEVLELTNDLIYFTSNVVKQLKYNGRPVKVGFSSPSYIYLAKNVKASLDGRKYGEPFAVHISPISSKIDISEILDFSSKLIYNDNCINGNVVDFILPSSYIKQPEKLVGILKSACSKGVFELQLNVMDKATLIDAKAHPENYPNLVVRVWGFSAYFNDLPDDYKDNLIRRAELYETA